MLKNLAISLVLFLGAQLVCAQDFLKIPASDYPISQAGVPTFSTQIDLGAAASQEDVSFELVYPEFKELSAGEVRMLRAQKMSFGPTVRIDYTEGISRKHRMADVSFVPIVVRNGKWYRVTSGKLQVNRKASAAASVQPSAVSDDRYAENSVLASGRWAKIRVSEEGIYELTAKDLKNMGFSDISRVKVYGYGGNPISPTFTFSGSNALIDDLCEIATFRKGNSLLFFAEGTTEWSWLYASGVWGRSKNIFSNYSYYFVTEGDNPLTIGEGESPAVTYDTFDFTMGHAIHEKDEFAWYEGGAEFFEAYDYINGNSQNYTLNLPNLLPDNTGRLSVAFSAGSPLRSSTLTTTLNETNLGSLTIASYSSLTESAREGRANYATTFTEEKNKVNLELTANTAGHLNYLIASYPRKLSGDDDAYAFIPITAKAYVYYTNQGRPATLSIDRATSGTQVWQIGRGNEPTVRYSGVLAGDQLTVDVPNNQYRYVIVDTNRSYPAPTYVGQVANQNLHADASYDMVIILPESGKMTQAADRLAKRHEAEGLRIKQVTADKLYNEFSSGTPHVAAYRRYMKMLYDKAASEEDMPKYLLLFGDCNWDNRFITMSGDPKDYLLAYEVSQTSRTTNISIGTMEDFATDDYFGYLDDGEGGNMASRDKIDIGIGRFLCHDAATANTLVDKTLNYMDNQHTGMWKNDIYMLADYGDNNLHMRDSESASEVIRSVNHNLVINKVFWDTYSITSTATGNTFPQVTEALRKDLKKGALVFNYVGHGDPNQISHAKLLTKSDFEAATDGNMPLWVFASCEITPYDQQISDLGRATLYNKNGGTVALVCANRSVQASANKPMNMEYIRYVLSRDSNGKVNTLGEAMRLAKNRLISNNLDITSNKLKYALLGDPALSLAIPSQAVVLDEINGEALDAYSLTQLKAGQVAEFSGHINLPDGLNVDENFNGILTARIYDQEVMITCKRNDPGTTSPMTYQTRPNKIYEGDAKVENGRFTLSFIVPRNISYSDNPARIVFYAISDDKQSEVNGTNEGFFLKGTELSGEDDQEGPAINMYLNEPDFTDGSIVALDPTLIVELDDLSGINFNGISIGHDIELVIDNNLDQIITLNDYFSYDLGSLTTGTISFPLTGLEPGWHTLTLRAWDLLDNASMQTIRFYVQAGVGSGFDINAIQDAAGSSVQLTVSFGAPSESGNLGIDVYDVAGRRVWFNRQYIAAGSTYYSATWNLDDYGHRAVPSGVYIYKATLEGSKTKAKTKGKKMLLKRP